MSDCHYCNSTGYETVRVQKYDNAMNEHYETNESRMCQYCGGKGYYPEASSTVTPSKSKVPKAKNTINKKAPKKTDVSGNIAGISLILAVIMAYFIYHASNPELNIFVATIATFIISNIVLHILYGLFIAVAKLGEIVLIIAFWAAVIIGISYASGAKWALNLVSSF